MIQLNERAKAFFGTVELLELLTRQIVWTNRQHVYPEKDLVNRDVDLTIPGIVCFVQNNAAFYPCCQFFHSGEVRMDVVQVNLYLTEIFAFAGIDQSRIPELICAWWDFPNPLLEKNTPWRAFVADPQDVVHLLRRYLLALILEAFHARLKFPFMVGIRQS